jgi:hypothetical protein
MIQVLIHLHKLQNFKKKANQKESGSVIENGIGSLSPK